MSGRGDIRRVFFAANRRKDSCLAAEGRLRQGLKAAGLQVLETWPAEGQEPADAIVLLGGDGFLMEFLHGHSFPEAPIFGVNFGTVGFLMNPHEQLAETPEILKEGRFSSISHGVIEAEAVLENGERETRLAFNEIALERQSGQSVRLRVHVDGSPFNRFAGDGFVISTAAGSTAYNLAAGGPALHPAVGGIVLTPLYPHRAEPFHSAQFSLVLPLGSEIRVVCEELPKRHLRLVADGQSLRAVAEVVVRGSNRRVTLLRSLGRGFVELLSRKFIGGLS